MAREPSGAVLHALREVFSGAIMRAAAGIRDIGELFLAKVENRDGGDLVDHEGDADLWVHYTDAISGLPGIARLFVPGNILFAQPHDADSVMVLRGADTGGPGAAYMLHGDAGSADRVPSWVFGDPPKDGLFTPRGLRLESKKEDVEVISADEADKKVLIKAGTTTITVRRNGKVEIDAGSNDIVFNGGTKKVARVDDKADGGSWEFQHSPASGSGVSPCSMTIKYTPPGGSQATIITSGTTSGSLNQNEVKVTEGAEHVKA
jgi:hypothetical protein